RARGGGHGGTVLASPARRRPSPAGRREAPERFLAAGPEPCPDPGCNGFVPGITRSLTGVGSATQQALEGPCRRRDRPREWRTARTPPSLRNASCAPPGAVGR